jgi:peptide chain release factor 1
MAGIFIKGIDMKRIVEIRAAEGGEDSRLFVKDLAQAYCKFADRQGWTTRLVDERPGETHVMIEGSDLSGLQNESGGHRIQRVPPTERKGRVHTSTVTVAIVDPNKPTFTVDEQDMIIEWYSGTGAGGQHRNKHQNSCRIRHTPTGIVVTAQCRSRQNSYAEAVANLQQAVDNKLQSQYNKLLSSDRRDQVGSGMRGDKIRTYRFQDDIVKDHLTGKTNSVKIVLAGNFNLLW